MNKYEKITTIFLRYNLIFKNIMTKSPVSVIYLLTKQGNNIKTLMAMS